MPATRWNLHLPLVLSACFMALPPVAVAQTPPRPAVEVVQVPTALRSLLMADFNRDGRLDLISDHADGVFEPSTDVVWRRGHGNGTFAAPRPIGVNGIPIATGDFNADARQDVVVLTAGEVSVLPGRGDGTFAAARRIAAVDDFRFALVADLNADGRPDLVVAHGTAVEVYAGLGALTFAPAMALPAGSEHGSAGGAVADFDGDGRLDLAVAQALHSVFLYRNHGGLLFTVSEIPIAFEEELRGIAAGDLNGDGRADLVVPHAHSGESYEDGGVEVLLGRGDGTFAAPVTYRPEVRGPLTAAIGDFNRDGIPDVAVGGRSALFFDEGAGLSYWDSISIFPGRGDGTLAAAASFRLDTSPGSGFDVYRGVHAALRAADLNGDGRADLIATPGAVILGRAPAVNRPPAIAAGGDRRAFACEPLTVRPALAEPDWDWLTVTWRADDGMDEASSPTLVSWSCETRTYTVTATDARGATATDRITVTRLPPPSGVQVIVNRPAGGQRFPAGSAIPLEWTASLLLSGESFRVSVSPDGFATARVIRDDVPNGVREADWENAGPPGSSWRVRVEVVGGEGDVVATGTSDPFTIDDPGGTALPWPWQSRDVGFVGAPGAATHTSGTFTVRGSGADIWGAADAFQFVYQRVDGDFTFEARVAGVEGTHDWTKAGLMVRRSLDADSAHHFLLASRGKGLAYQRRIVKGFESEHTSLETGSVGVTFRVRRAGGSVRLEIRRAGETAFSTVAVQPLAEGPVYIGLAVTSHDFARLATGTFDGVAVRPGGPGTLPAVWDSYDVGAVAAAGSGSFDPATGRFTVKGSGADIWATRDAFHFVSRLMGDVEDGFEMTARVTAVQNVHRWTKAGLMIRAHRGASAPHASLFVTPTAEKGIAFQRRPSEGGASVHTAGPALTAPVWLRFVVRGGSLRAFYRSRATDPWTFVGTEAVEYDDGFEIGLAVSSHVDGTTAEAVFDHVSVRHREFFASEDVGAVGLPGTSSSDGLVTTITGSGVDIWGTADAFHYRFADVSANGSISARVLSVQRTHAWAKAGVMIREDLSPGARHVMLIVSPGRGIAMQARIFRDAPAVNAAIVPGAAPAWVRLSHEGDDIVGEISTDGLTWREIGRVGLPMGDFLTAGLVVTSHDNSRVATAVFDDVVLQR